MRHQTVRQPYKFLEPIAAFDLLIAMGQWVLAPEEVEDWERHARAMCEAEPIMVAFVDLRHHRVCLMSVRGHYSDLDYSGHINTPVVDQIARELIQRMVAGPDTLQ